MILSREDVAKKSNVFEYESSDPKLIEALRPAFDSVGSDYRATGHGGCVIAQIIELDGGKVRIRGSHFTRDYQRVIEAVFTSFANESKG